MKRPNEFYHHLFTESPLYIGDGDEKYYNIETRAAMDKYSEILSNPKIFKKVHTIPSNPPVHLYEETDGNDAICWFVPTNNKFIYGYVTYEKRPDGGIITTSVYNDRKFPGVASKVYQEHLLKNYKYIMSDSRHTRRGKDFWRKLVVVTLDNPRLGKYIWDLGGDRKVVDIVSTDVIESFYSDENEGMENFRIRIKNFKI